jgi:hypothetical protein
MPATAAARDSEIYRRGAVVWVHVLPSKYRISVVSTGSSYQPGGRTGSPLSCARRPSENAPRVYLAIRTHRLMVKYAEMTKTIPMTMASAMKSQGEELV